MSNCSHTPGPWSVDETGGQHHVLSKSGYVVAQVSPLFAYRKAHAANAALLAAAPALLHAAQLARDVLAAKGVRGDTELMTALDNAIAQAKGR